MITGQSSDHTMVDRGGNSAEASPRLGDDSDADQASSESFESFAEFSRGVSLSFPPTGNSAEVSLSLILSHWQLGQLLSSSL